MTKNLIVEINQDIGKRSDKIQSVLSEKNFCIIRGAIDPKIVKNGIKKVKKYIEKNDDNPVTGESPSAVRDYFMKLSLGEARHSGKKIDKKFNIVRPRFKRVIYSPLFKQDIFKLDEVFIRFAKIRNFLMGVDPEYALREDKNNKMWTASRIHQFPRGGGFMSSHVDTVLPSIIKKDSIGKGFFQPILIMSQKGKDFESGGGFAKIDGKNVIYEDFTEIGDIAIYNSFTEHGCFDIDTHKPFFQRSGNGRFSGLCTLYKTLN